ncbi:MAG: BatD family protein [Planctomycetes bacterium]|nr:BatD family protein [Planctomycetota bacterium]
MHPRANVAVGLLLSFTALAVPAVAQERLSVGGPEPATVRLGDTARVELRITDPGGRVRELKLPTVDGLRLQAFGPSQQIEERWDGQRRTQKVTVLWQVEVQPLREGAFVVPPFPVWTGSKEQSTRELRLEAKKDLRGEELGWLDVQVEPRRVYVHEPIRVRIDAGVQQGLRLVQGRANNGQTFYDVEVQASWLEQFPAGEPIELPAPTGELGLIVRGGNNLMLCSQQDDHERNGQRWRRFSFERAFLPTRIGKLELPGPLLRYHVIRREGQQDVFGLRRGGLSENYYAQGKPITVEVLPIPEAGRPTPYYGAVGRFSIAAALDRDSVKVGSSVKLSLTVRGQGNLEFLRLPPLDAVAGFHKLGQAEAKRSAEQVVVTYDLTPLSTDVKAVPAIGWNYFDTTPGVERFVEVATAPLPLQVLALPPGETLAPLANTETRAVTPGVDDIFDLPSFDGPPALAASVPAWQVWLALLLPWFAFGLFRFAAAARARAVADVTGQRAARAHKAALAALQRGEDPLAALAGYLGDRLGVPAAAVIAPDLGERLQQARLEPDAVRDVVQAIEQGTAARYGGGAALGGDAVRTLLQRLERLRFGIGLWLLAALVSFAAGDTPLRAQTDAPPTGVVAVRDGAALYRAGDHAGADAAFAQEFARSGDRRWLQARGNCLVRLGDLPRALWAYEGARRGRPRDPELLANLRWCRTRLELDTGGSGFAAELEALRQRWTPGEQLWGCAVLMAAAAGCLVFGWRRLLLRWVAVLLLVPGLWLGAELAWLGPARAPLAVALRPLALVSEPRADLPAVANVRAGVLVELRGSTEGAFVRIQAGDRTGYVPSDSVAAVP